MIIYYFKIVSIVGSFTLISNKQRVCNPLERFTKILSSQESGSQLSVNQGIEIIDPKEYKDNPQHPQALIIEAL